jgi:hypothetical protein
VGSELDAVVAWGAERTVAAEVVASSLARVQAFRTTVGVGVV